jgi:hypothetical protein
MSRDFLIPVRKAILAALKAHEPLIALVPAARMYPPTIPTMPTRPFLCYGAGAVSFPWKSSGENGQRIIGTVHSFASAKDSEPDAEEYAGRMNNEVTALLEGSEGEGLSLDIGSGVRAYVRVTGTRVIRDWEEAQEWHGIADIEVVVSAPA